jgi:tRNA C32,U32 (ribose-2'-O)-methylase TrmJ
MRQNLEAAFTRMEPTDQELRTLHGAVKALRFPRQRGGTGS